MTRGLGNLMVLVVVALVVVAPARAAVTAIGERAVVDLHGTADDQLGTVMGLAAATDGTAYVADVSGQYDSVPDDCGNPYVPLRVHRVQADGSQPAHRTLAYGAGVTQFGTPTGAPIALARTASSRTVLLVGVDGTPDADGDGTCTPPSDPVTLLALDPDTLATVAAFTVSQLGGLAIQQLSVAPTPAGPTPVLAFAAPDGSSPAVLERFGALPDAAGPLSPTATRTFDDGLGDPSCPVLVGGSTPMAAQPDGGVLLSAQSSCTFAGAVWHLGPGLGAADLWRESDDELPFPPSAPIAAAADGTVLLDHSYPAYDANGFQVQDPGQDLRAGVARLTAAGALRDAFGVGDTAQGPGPAYAPCSFAAVYQTGTATPALAAAGDQVVTASQEQSGPFNPPDDGPRLRWFGDGPLQPACLVRPQPDARLTATPSSPAPGDLVTLDATASTARHFGTEHDARLTTVAWRIGAGADWSAPEDVAGGLLRTVRFDVPGSYPIDVRITDSYGQSRIGRADVFVPAPEPVARLTAPTTPKVGEAVTLDASASTGPPVRYEFDLDGDGRYETDGATHPTITHRFVQAGPVDVGLRVTNNVGVAGTTTLHLDVQRPGDPSLPAQAQDGTLAPAAGASAPTAPATPPGPAARVTSEHVLRPGGRLRVRFACLADGADCAGHLVLERSVVAHGRTRHVAASTRSALVVAHGRTRTVDLRLGTWARATVRRRGSVRLVATAALDGAGPTVVVRRAATVKGRAR